MKRCVLRPVLAGALLLAAAGCGPIEYIATVPLDAAGAIAEAKHVGADHYAPYEITAAREYIQKSRELAGYARFQSSLTFGRKAADNAEKAKRLALENAALPHEDEPAAATSGKPAAGTTTTKPAAPAEHAGQAPSRVLVAPAGSPDKSPDKPTDKSPDKSPDKPTETPTK